MAIRQTLVAITVDSMDAAKELLRDLRAYDNNTSDLAIIDAVYATKDETGNMKIHQTADVEGGQGALGGGVVGLIAGGLVFGPVGAAIGTALGGVLAGVYSSLRDSGMNNRVMKNIVRDMQSNQTTLILLYEGTMHPSMNTLFANHNARLFYTNLPTGAADDVRSLLNSSPETLTELNNYSISADELNTAYEREMPVYVVDGDEHPVQRLDEKERPINPGDVMPVVPLVPMAGNMGGGMVAPAVIPLMAETMAQDFADVPPGDDTYIDSNRAVDTSTPTGRDTYTQSQLAGMARDEKMSDSAEASVVHLKSDDLKQITGIDTEIEQVLRNRDIKTFVQLSHASTSEIRNALTTAGIAQPASISTWTEQAWLAAQGKHDELHDLQTSLKN